MPDINGSLKRFNTWWDEFILEAIKPVAILSMGLGTVAIFNLQGLAIQPWFVISWAIVQALSIDGLFFATWDRLFALQLQRSNGWAIVGLSFIGFTLALVAIAINAILGFQVLWSIADSQIAMTRLGVSSELFTAIRAVLAVTVFVMIAFVRSRATVTTAPEKAIVATAMEAQSSPKKALIVEEQSPQKAIAEHSVAIDRATDNQSHKEKIKAVWLRHAQEGRTIKLTDIASDAGVGYSTVKKWSSAIRAEIEQSA